MAKKGGEGSLAEMEFLTSEQRRGIRAVDRAVEQTHEERRKNEEYESIVQLISEAHGMTKADLGRSKRAHRGGPGLNT